MLFQRLYNWIKYKTLPSSFLFKNRLFIERDSKHRRVLSNFGLSFRNSKWSNYETYNIKLQFRKSYFRFIFWITAVLLFFGFLFYFNQYYIIFYFFNNIAFFFWISIDTFDYYLSFLTWMFTIFFSMIFNLVYSYFFFNHFSNDKLSSVNLYNNSFTKLPVSTSVNSKDLYISKHDLNWLLYSWLTNTNSSKNTFILENIFETQINKSWWDSYNDFFLKLYKLSYFLKLTSSDSSSFVLNTKLNNFSNLSYKGDYSKTVNFFNNNVSLNNHTGLIFYYIINNYVTYFDKISNKNSSLSFLKNNFEWNLYNLNNELESNSLLVKSKSGMFFLDDFNYQKFSYFIFNFEELWSLNFFFKNQLNSSKWNRWLYRYSILHRKILKFSHKLTLSKRLISSGFYDSKIFNKNIWASEHLNKITTNDSFSSFFTNYYSNIFKKEPLSTMNYFISTSNNGSQNDTLNLLNFYESSYFWYLKRFYLFNSLPTNFIKSKVKFNNYQIKNLNIIKDSNFTKYSVFLSYLLNSNLTNLNHYSHFNNSYFDNNTFYSQSKTYYTSLKDLYMLSNDNDILNKDNLNLFYWISSGISNQNSLSYFNYLNTLKCVNNQNTNISFFINQTDQNNNLDLWLAYSLINMDKFYLNDVVYLSLFN
jgi:hypothetical protein